MKKSLLFAAAAILTAANIQAQSVRFVQDGVMLENNATVTLASDFNEEVWAMEWTPVLRNTTDKDVNITLVVDVTTISDDNSMLTFCIGTMCYPPETTESTVLTIPAGGEISSYHTQFMPMNDNSYAEATYYIMNQDNDEDICTAHIKYDYPAFLAAVDKTTITSQIKMLQRGDNLVCKYNFDTNARRNVVVSNIVGACVASVALEGNSGEVVLNRLPKGVYVYTLVENGRNVKSHKIIVR